MNAKDALKRAAGTFKNPPSEMPVGSDRVRLRHLLDALELVSGKAHKDALAILHDALVSGKIGSQAVGTSGQKDIISANTWPQLDPEPGYNGWITGEIFHEHHLPGFVGTLPTVDRRDADGWLKLFQQPPSVGRPSKQKKAADAYRVIYPNGHRADGDTWKQAAIKVTNKTGEIIAVKTLSRAVKNHQQNP